LIIGQDIRALLDIGEVIQNDDRYFLKIHGSGGSEPGVACEDARVAVDQYWIGEAKLADTVGNLLNLVGAV
jgi:hypothetical protein